MDRSNTDISSESRVRYGYWRTSELYGVRGLCVRREPVMGHCEIQDSFNYELVTMCSDMEETGSLIREIWRS